VQSTHAQPLSSGNHSAFANPFIRLQLWLSCCKDTISPLKSIRSRRGQSGLLGVLGLLEDTTQDGRWRGSGEDEALAVVCSAFLCSAFSTNDMMQAEVSSSSFPALSLLTSEAIFFLEYRPFLCSLPLNFCCSPLSTVSGLFSRHSFSSTFCSSLSLSYSGFS
jgi:hypothetical protein